MGRAQCKRSLDGDLELWTFLHLYAQRARGREGFVCHAACMRIATWRRELINYHEEMLQTGTLIQLRNAEVRKSRPMTSPLPVLNLVTCWRTARTVRRALHPGTATQRAYSMANTLPATGAREFIIRSTLAAGSRPDNDLEVGDKMKMKDHTVSTLRAVRGRSSSFGAADEP